MTILSTLGDLCDTLAFGVKDVVDKAKEGAKTYAASTPQGQAVSMAMKATEKKPNAATSPKGVAVASKMTARQTGGKVGLMDKIKNKFTTKTLFGIPLLFVVGGGIGVMFILRKRMKK